MDQILRLTVPFDAQTARTLHAGQQVLLCGRVLTARDAAHKRLCELLDQHQPLPVDLRDQVVYFVGPTPARPGRCIGAAGPTTSSRMDKYSPKLLAVGLRGMIGKGYRSKEVVAALQKYQAVHFSAIGGLGALLGKCVKSAKILAYEDLGTEAIRELIVEDLPVIVAYDCQGNTVYAKKTPTNP
ncbi:MAG: Fe-S-containing hydro-lyase [Phycisphaerae bacterium]